MAQATSNLSPGAEKVTDMPKEGKLTKTIEQQTAKIPSIGFLSLAVGSILLSGGLALFSSRKDLANFVGLWVPSLLLIGIYNKLVKLEGGSDFVSKAS